MSKTQNQMPKDKLDLFIKLLEKYPDIELKGAKTPYTSLNGN